MHLILRADGGPGIGYGHLVRTGALAQYALDQGDQVTYATSTPDAVRDVCPDDIRVESLSPNDTHREFLRQVDSHQPDVIITDSYDFDTEKQASIAKRKPILGVILDDDRFTIKADILINGNIYAPDLSYEWIGSEPEWCLGIDYVLLRRKIRDLAQEAPQFHENPERALITLGGSDVRGMTPDIVKAFGGTNLHVEVVIGPGFENHEAIYQAVSESTGSFETVEQPDDLPERMWRADLAVSATGSTIYELLALGTPTIGLPQADNQIPTARALSDQGALMTLDGIGLANAIQSLTNDLGLRRELWTRGRELIDGLGVERVYDAID